MPTKLKCKSFRSGNVYCTPAKLPVPWAGKHCLTCGTPWAMHHAVEKVCEKLGHTRSALYAILSWAKDKSGRSLYPTEVAKLCTSALEVSKP